MSFTVSSNFPAELEQIVIGMSHRGRLNVLTGFFNLPPVKIFAKLKGKPDFPLTFEATGDILSHLSTKLFTFTAGYLK